MDDYVEGSPRQIVCERCEAETTHETKVGWWHLILTCRECGNERYFHETEKGDIA